MDERQERELKADFRKWSGGFSPESGDQITVYVDYALERGIDPDEARDFLWTWMESDDPDSDLADSETLSGWLREMDARFRKAS